MEIFGRGGKFYGWLSTEVEPPALYYSGPSGEKQAVVRFKIGDKWEARSISDDLLGSAERGGGMFSSGSDWKLQAAPGQDAVLLISCMLALEILR
jgi:hypothetical protein